MLSIVEPPRRRILVVDDEPSVVELITTRLDLAGYQTFSARDGHHALTRMWEVQPAAIILDINMPRLDGFGVLRRMGATGGIKRFPTMVLTARNQADDVKLAISLGARDFLAKPFRDDQLLQRVSRLLQRPRLRPAPPAGDDNSLML